MSSGKILNLGVEYPKVNISSHLINTKNIKSFYILVSGYFDIGYDDLLTLRTTIAKTIKKNLNKELFYTERFIEVEEIRISKEWNYAGYEYTIFLKRENKISIKELEVETKKLTDLIYETHFDKPDFNINEKNNK